MTAKRAVLVLILEIELTAKFNNMKSDLNNLAQKIGELEGETEEHKYLLTRCNLRNFFSSCYSLLKQVYIVLTRCV